MPKTDAVRVELERDPSHGNAFAPDRFPVLGLAIFFRQPAVARYLTEQVADVKLRAANAARVAPIHAAYAL